MDAEAREASLVKTLAIKANFQAEVQGEHGGPQEVVVMWGTHEARRGSPAEVREWLEALMRRPDYSNDESGPQAA